MVYAGTAGSDQIGAVTVNVNHGATLDLNGNSDTVGAITMTGGTIETGAGTLTLGGNLTYNVGGQAVINGNLDLGGTAAHLCGERWSVDQRSGHQCGDFQRRESPSRTWRAPWC